MTSIDSEFENNSVEVVPTTQPKNKVKKPKKNITTLKAGPDSMVLVPKDLFDQLELDLRYFVKEGMITIPSQINLIEKFIKCGERSNRRNEKFHKENSVKPKCKFGEDCEFAAAGECKFRH